METVCQRTAPGAFGQHGVMHQQNWGTRGSPARPPTVRSYRVASRGRGLNDARFQGTEPSGWPSSGDRLACPEGAGRWLRVLHARAPLGAAEQGSAGAAAAACPVHSERDAPRGGLPPSHLPLGPGAQPPVPHWRPASPSTRPRPPPAVPGPVWLAPCGANQGWEIKKAQSPPPAPPASPRRGPRGARGRRVRVGPVPLPACCRRRRSPPGAGRAGPAPGPGRAPRSGCGRPPAGGHSSARARRRP